MIYWVYSRNYQTSSAVEKSTDSGIEASDGLRVNGGKLRAQLILGNNLN